MKPLRVSAFGFGVAGAAVLFCCGAQAKCEGGSAVTGSFGATINGPLVSGNNAEIYNGILVSDGKCGLTGSLTGGTFGQPSTTQSVTGSYAVPANKEGTMSLLLSGASSAVTFGFGLVKDGKAVEIAGVATSGPAVATLQATAIAKKNYSVSDVSGQYVVLCTGAGNSGSGGFGSELGYASFDGAGNAVVDVVGNNNGSAFSGTGITATYTVSKSGALAVQDGGAYTNFSATGELVSNGTELRSILIQGGSGGGPYRTCFTRKQS